jgi:hypothetical protein
MVNWRTSPVADARRGWRHGCRAGPVSQEDDMIVRTMARISLFTVLATEDGA